MIITTQARNATLGDLAEILRTQQDAKLDAVVPAGAIRSEDGTLTIDGVTPVIPDTVDEALNEAAHPTTSGPGRFVPTEICDGHLADKLGIPVAYLRRLRAERVDLFDANVNGWLRGALTSTGDLDVGPDPRAFLVRCFVGDPGVCRAVLSDSYKRMDNLDILTAALDAIREAGVGVSIDACDLSETRMLVKMSAPEVTAYAPTLLAGYRSPFSGLSGADLPVVHAGLVISNSETGGGAFTVVPRLVVQVCKNGLTRTVDAVRAVHLGSKLTEGVVRWSTATEERNLDLVRSQTKDAVTTFLDVDYMRMVLDDVEAKSGTALAQPVETVKVVAQRLRFSQETLDGLLDHFVRAGDPTAGGVMQAVTSYAQTVTDPDLSWSLECSAFDALDAAVAVG